MSRLSPTGLLLLAAMLVPVAIEFPVVLSMVGIEFPMSLSFGLAGLVFVAVLVWSEVSDPTGSSTES